MDPRVAVRTPAAVSEIGIRIPTNTTTGSAVTASSKSPSLAASSPSPSPRRPHPRRCRRRRRQPGVVPVRKQKAAGGADVKNRRALGDIGNMVPVLIDNILVLGFNTEQAGQDCERAGEPDFQASSSMGDWARTNFNNLLSSSN